LGAGAGGGVRQVDFPAGSNRPHRMIGATSEFRFDTLLDESNSLFFDGNSLLPGVGNSPVSC
jgi:hypothetical protein